MSVLDSILSEVSEKNELHRQSAAAEFRKMARLIADGTKPDTAQLQKVMADAEKTADDLRDAVTLHQKRKANAAKLKEASEAEAEIADLDAKLAKAESALAAATAAYEKAATPLKWRLREIADLQQQADTARNALLTTCPDETINRELAAICRRVSDLNQTIRQLKAQSNNRSEGTEMLNRMGLGTGIPAGAITTIYNGRMSAELSGDSEQRARNIIAAADYADKELPNVEKEIAKLKKREAELIELQLQA